MAAIPIIVYAIDVNGVTQNGAKLFTYEAGTTTNQATYVDAALTTPAANPVVCNAAGFAVVYADSSLDDYKLVLKNSAESTTLFQQDNLTTGDVTPALIIYPWLGGDQLLSTTDTPTFAGLTLGNVSFAGVVTDPNADRGMFWDDSAGQVAFFALGTGLNFNGTTLELDGDLADISGLTPADGAVIIGDGTDFVTESGATLRNSLGLGPSSAATFASLTLASGATVTAILDEDNMVSNSATAIPTQQSVKAYADSLADTIAEINAITQSDGTFIVSDGTSWVGEAGATARASLGLTIGTDVQAYDADLTAIAALSNADGNIMVGNGSAWVAESGATARASLGAETTEVEDVTALGTLPATDYDTLLVKQVQTAKEIFAATYNVPDVTPYYYEANVKTTADSLDVVLPSGVTANDAGRFKRAPVLDNNGDTPLPLPYHLQYAYEGIVRGNAKPRPDYADPLVRGMRMEGNNTAANYDLVGLYSDFVPWKSAAEYDTLNMRGSDEYTFTIPNSAMGRIDAQITVQCGTAGNDFIAEMWKLPTPTNSTGWAAQGGGTGSPIAWSTTVNLKKTTHGLSVGDVVSLNVSASNLPDLLALDGRFFELAGVPDADTIQIVVPTAFSSAPSSGSIVVTAASTTTITTTSAHGLGAADWVYLEDVDGVTDGWYQLFNAPTTTTFNIIGISATGVTGSPLAYPLSATMTVDDYVNISSRDVLAHSQIDVTSTGTPHVISVSSGIRQFTAGDVYGVRLRAPSGSSPLLPASNNSFNPATFLEYQEYAGLAGRKEDPILGRNLAIPQGNIEYMFADVQDAIDNFSTFTHVCLSGVATINDSSVAIKDIAWPTDTRFAEENGIAATRYTNQRQLCRGIRAKNERSQIWGYVSMAADAPRGTIGGQGTASNPISIAGASTSLSINNITFPSSRVLIETTSAHGLSDDDWIFIPSGGGGGVTDIENAGFPVDVQSSTTFYLMPGDHVATDGQYIDSTGFSSYTSGGTVNDFWTLTDVPNVRAWINAWREDGADGIFFDLSASQWCTEAVRDLAIRECRKAGLKAMYNVTVPAAAGANTSWILGSDYVAPGDYVFYEGAGGAKVNAGAGLSPSSGTNTISNLNAELAVLDADMRGVAAAMLYTEEDPVTDVVSIGVASIAVDSGTGVTTVTFDANHPYVNGDVIRFNNFRDDNNLWMDTLNGINFTVANGGSTPSTQTTLELSGFDGRTLTTYSKTNSDAKLCNVGIVRSFTNSGALWAAFKAIVDARPERDAAGASGSGLGLFNRAPFYNEPDWGGFEQR